MNSHQVSRKLGHFIISSRIAHHAFPYSYAGYKDTNEEVKSVTSQTSQIMILSTTAKTSFSCLTTRRCDSWRTTSISLSAGQRWALRSDIHAGLISRSQTDELQLSQACPINEQYAWLSWRCEVGPSGRSITYSRTR